MKYTCSLARPIQFPKDLWNLWQILQGFFHCCHEFSPSKHYGAVPELEIDPQGDRGERWIREGQDPGAIVQPTYFTWSTADR